jgi:alkyl sulfatase BDS1-like metallo-beta-lactamase superfamily hydrolase
MSNSALTNIKGQQAKNPDLTITVNRSDLNGVMGGQTTFENLTAQGKAKFVGDKGKFEQLKSVMTTFTPDFELIPGTKIGKTPPAAPVKDPLQVIQPAPTAGE